jgi:hypothetical protein
MKWLKAMLGWDRDAVPASTEHLVERVDVFVVARCPCGSEHEHQLALHSVSLCRRCGQEIAIRSLQYVRQDSAIPRTSVHVGPVASREALRRRATTGVH